MKIIVNELFEQYADAYARGERPDASSYLDRAGAEADQLGQMIDRFLQATPPRPSRPEDERELEEWLREPPLLRARVSRGLTRERVVDALVKTLGLDVRKRDKVDSYYHRLEVGLLEPEQVDRRVYGVLAKLFGTSVTRYLKGRPHAPALADAYFRTETPRVAAEVLPSPAFAQEPDEIDRLFTGAGEPA